MFIPEEEDDTWMLASTRTAPYYWLLHNNGEHSMHIHIIIWIIVVH